MKLHLTRAAGQQLITGYEAGWVEVNDTRYTKSLIVLPNLLQTDWPVPDFDSLQAEHVAQIAALQPEVVLLGTGPHPSLCPSPHRPAAARHRREPGIHGYRRRLPYLQHPHGRRAACRCGANYLNTKTFLCSTPIL